MNHIHKFDKFVRESEDCMGGPVRLYRCECGHLSNWCYESLWSQDEAIVLQRKGQADPAPEKVKPNLNSLAKTVHAAQLKWWQNPETGEPVKRNKAELICLMHSELSEAMEGERKDLMDDKLPHRKMAEVELVDCIIRILDYAGAFGYDLDSAFVEKMAFNASREDHTHEARRITGGKQF